MPFRDAERARQWNREYQQKRDARARVGRVALEEKIIAAVLKEPCHHDELSLSLRFRTDGIPLPAVTRVVNHLLKEHVLYWETHRSENSACHRSGLALTNRAKELFAPSAGRPDGERAHDDREGLGE